MFVRSWFGGERIAEGEEGGFGVELGVEGERALGQAVFAWAEALQPGIAVGEAPGQDGFYRIVAEDAFEEAAVDVGDLAVAFGDVARHERIVYVEFGDEDLQVEFFNFQ